MVLDPGPETPPLVEQRPMRGFHAGLVVFAGVLMANLGNYVFQLISARELGPSAYSDLATLLAIVSLIGLPLGGLQLWVARHVAEFRAEGESTTMAWFVRRSAFWAAIVAAVATTTLLALSQPVQNALGIGSLGAVALTALLTLPAVVTPVVWGLAQGLERFTLISLMVASAPTVRIALAVAGFALGLGVFGAMAATFASNLLTLLVPIWILRRWFRRTGPPRSRISRSEAARMLLPVIVGLLAITALTTIDVVVAKRALSDHDAGLYDNASLIGRVILYLPTAIVTVLLPRVAARTAGSRESLDLLGRSLLVTAGVCGSITLVYAVAPHLIVRIAFGSDYLGAAPLLWRFGIAMSCFSLLNILFVYHLGRHEHWMSWILGAGALVQLAAFGAFHSSGRDLVTVDIALAVVLLIAHETWSRGVLTRALASTCRQIL